MTNFGLENRSTQDMAQDAVFQALNDADIDLSKIDACVSSCMDLCNNGERQRHSASMLSSLLKKQIPIIRIPAGCAGSGHALWHALNLEYNNILVLGFEKLVANTTSQVTDEIIMGGERIYEQSEGLTFPAQNALVAQDYMSKYSATMNDLALISSKNHENGEHNEKARFYKKKITIEQIEQSPIIASPLRLFDCCTNANGAAACIISKDKSDIKIAGSGLFTDFLSPVEREDMSTWTSTIEAAKQAYRKANLTAQDIDFVEIHDAFTPIELISYEDLGFCKKGEGKNLIRDGTTKLDGSLPVNPCGGLKAKGHPLSATGLAQIYEIINQMRREVNDRQLSKTKTALAQNIGGAGSTVSVHILRRTGG